MIGELVQHKKTAFLETFAKLGNITKSAQAVGIHRNEHYYWMETDEEYVKAYRESLQTFKDSVDFEIFRRGMVGIDEPVIYQGQHSKDANGNPVTVRRMSDTLLIVKAKQLGVFVERREIGGFGGGPISVTFYIPDNGRDPRPRQGGSQEARRDREAEQGVL